MIRDFLKLYAPLKKTNFILTIALTTNFLLSTTNAISANYNQRLIVKGDKEKLITIANTISKYTPFEEKIDLLSKKDTTAFLEKPEIIDTKTRAEIEENKLKEEKRKLTLTKRNVYARERTNYQNKNNASSSSYNVREKNTYWYGFCTWYVANRRQDIPNQWGNAKSWLSSAQSSGWPTGTEPREGAIIVTRESWAGHVGYVESINGNKIIISEMNYKGWGKVSTRELDINDPIIRGYIY